MHTNKSAGYRVLSFLLALVLTLGLFPITPAQAATNNGNGIIAAMDKEGKSVQYMQMSKAKYHPVVRDSEWAQSSVCFRLVRHIHRRGWQQGLRLLQRPHQARPEQWCRRQHDHQAFQL